MHHLDPDHGLHPAEVGEDDHHRAEQDDRIDRNRFRVRPGLESDIDGGEHDGRQEESHAVGDVAHDDEERGGEHLDLEAEATFEQLVDGQEFAAKVGGDEQERDDDAPEQVAEDELEKLKISAAGKRDAGDGDEGDGRSLGRHDACGDRPPRHGAVAEKIVARRLLLAGEPDAERRDADEIAEDDKEIERSHSLPWKSRTDKVKD